MEHDISLATLVTPVVATFNEENNILRQLQSLQDFKNVIVIDSFSSDKTHEICQRFDNVSFHQRIFDNFSNQWTYAISLDEVNTPWVLALDADYFLTKELLAEMADKFSSSNDNDIDGYSCRFKYCINGQPIKGSIYPPVTILYKKTRASYIQDGHTQRIIVNGNIASLNHYALHDDRKSLERWLLSQRRYAQQEAFKLKSKTKAQLSFKDRLRKAGLSPILVPLTVILKGGLFSGKNGLIYIAQRTIAECLLVIYLCRSYDKNP